MKKPFLKKILNLLEKEICHEDIPKDSHPLHVFKKNPAFFHDKSAYIASKCLKPQETVLSEGVSVKGELHFDRQLRINGNFEGFLCSPGKIIVGPSGSVKGDIELDEAEIHGKVLGNITVKHLFLSSTARVLGNIKASSLHIEKGAKLTGQVEIDALRQEDLASCLG